MNTKKKKLTKQENLFCDEEDDNIDDLKFCIESLNSLKNNYFEENQYQGKSIRHNDLIPNTYIKTPKWLELKKSVLNPNNNYNKCFQYSVVLSLYHEQLGRNYCRISKIKKYVDNFNWENINFPPQEQDYKTVEMNNKSIALNVLITPINEDNKKLSHLYKSEFNKTREKQSILLILTDECNSKKTLCCGKEFKFFVQRQKQVYRTLLY